MSYHKRKKLTTAICAGALVLLCLGCSQKDPSGSPTNETDGCKLYYGLNQEEVALDAQEEKDLEDFILHYQLRETTNEPIPAEELILGGPYFQATFSDGGTTYQWTFNPNRITKTVSQNGGSVTTYYAPDSALLTHLESYRR